MLKSNSIKLIKYKSHFPLLLLIILPYTFIIGPLVLEIVANSIGLYFLYIVFKNKNYSLLRNSFTYIFFIFYFYIILRSIFSFDPYFTLSTSFFYFRFLFFTLGVLLILKNFKNAENLFLKNTMIAVFLVSFVLLLECLFFSKISPFYDPIYVRYFSLFLNEPIPGSYISRFLPYAILCIFCLYKKFSNRIFSLAILISLLVISIYISGERTAFFYSLVTLSVFFLIYNFNIKFKLVLASMFIFIFAMINILDSRARERMISFTKTQMFSQNNQKSFIIKNDQNNIDSVSQKTLKTREIEASNFPGFSSEHKRHFYSAYLMFKDNPIFGQGPKAFRMLCKKSNFFVPGACTTHPHNTILQILAEIGLVGIVFYLIILIWILSFFFKILYKKFIKFNPIGENDNFKILYFSALLICFFPFVPSGNFFNNWLSFNCYLPFAFIFNRSSYYNAKIK